MVSSIVLVLGIVIVSRKKEVVRTQKLEATKHSIECSHKPTRKTRHFVTRTQQAEPAILPAPPAPQMI